MPYIINKSELMGIASEVRSSVAELQAIWNDKQYQYFCDNYAVPLVHDLKELEDKMDDIIYRVFNLQTKLENM